MARMNAERRAKLRIIEECRLVDVKEAAQDDPKALIAEINAFDPTTMEHFRFTMFPEGDDPLWVLPTPRGDAGWLWQSALVDWWTGVANPLFSLFEAWSPNFHFDPEQRVFLTLKARQLGVTWTAVALMLWYMLFRPGSKCVIYSYNEDEAKKAITRAWLMYQSLPEILRDQVEVITPERGEPSEFIKVKHKVSGLISSIQALPATPKAGHGDTITFAAVDEAAYNQHLRKTFKAIVPATGRGDARLAIISTADGVGNAQTGEGNYFHVLYTTKAEKGIAFSFIPWHAEPTRDQAWYERVAMKMDEVERNQSYPLNENDAFMLSGDLFFDRAALDFYRRNIRRPLLRGQFVQQSLRELRWQNLIRDGIIDIYEKPVPNRKYALAADTATGRGADYTSMGVMDLETGIICAELHAKLDGPRAALQAHALGKYYNSARIAPERQGGYGEALITFLRDGSRGLPPYANLYRHTEYNKGKKPVSQEYGFPMNAKTRAQALGGLQEWVREQQFPWLTAGIVDEMGSFVRATTNPSPRAADGTHDDRVMMLAILVDLFRQFGKPPSRGRRKLTKRAYEPHPSRR